MHISCPLNAVYEDLKELSIKDVDKFVSKQFQGIIDVYSDVPKHLRPEIVPLLAVYSLYKTLPTHIGEACLQQAIKEFERHFLQEHIDANLPPA